MFGGPPDLTHCISSAASDVYRHVLAHHVFALPPAAYMHVGRWWKGEDVVRENVPELARLLIRAVEKNLT